MLILALDTSTAVGSVALIRDGHVVEERPGDARRRHAEQLPGGLVSLLTAHHLRMTDVGAFAVAAGPGSFTGIRVGLATMQGLALASRRSVLTVSTLEAFAELGVHQPGRDWRPGESVGVWLDAHRGEVFAALFGLDRADVAGGLRIHQQDGPLVGAAADVASRWRRIGLTPSALVCPEPLSSTADDVLEGLPRVAPDVVLAGWVGRIAARRTAAGEGPPPHAARPLYVRRPDAELAREAAAGRPGTPP